MIPLNPVIDIQIWWRGITKMPISDSDIRGLGPKDNRFRVSIGDALHIEVYPNGGKYFVWRYRFPPGRNGQRNQRNISMNLLMVERLYIVESLVNLIRRRYSGRERV